jgi:hypothetical protein
MKKFLNISFIVFILFFSCKKDAVQSKINAAPNVSNVGQGPQKYDLISLGGGVYQYPDFQGLTIQVTDIWYKTLDDYGLPLGVTDGAPIYGTIHVINGGSISIAQQPNSYPQNSFDIEQGVISGGNGGPDFDAYTSAFNTAISNWSQQTQSWLNVWPTNPFFPPPVPTFNAPNFANYVSTGGAWSASWRSVSGKLIRSSTGSGFALADANYPVATRPLPQIPYATNKASQTLTAATSIAGGITTVTLVDNSTLSGITPTFIFKLTSSNQLHQTGSAYDVSSTYSGISWSQFAELFPNFTVINGTNKIAFGLMGKFATSPYTGNCAIWITYNYSTKKATISYNDSNYLQYWQQHYE